MGEEVAYGLLAALGWGSGDFLAKLSSDRMGYLRTALYMQLISAVFLLIFAFPDFPRLSLNPLAAMGAVGLGVVSLVGLLAFYKGFQVGRVSIVSPITSGYPVLTSTLAVVLLGEVISEGRAVGIILTLAGVVLVSIQSQKRAELSEARVSSGIPYALAAFTMFGLLYFAMKLVVISLGVWLPILILRWVSSSILMVSLLASRRVVSLPSLSSLRIVGSVAVLDTFGNIAFNLGVVSGSVAIVSTLSGLFSAVTIGLAWLLLREHVTWHQLAGILAILVGIVFIGYFV